MFSYLQMIIHRYISFFNRFIFCTSFMDLLVTSTKVEDNYMEEQDDSLQEATTTMTWGYSTDSDSG